MEGGKVTRKDVVQKVACQLTDDELLRYGRALAQTEDDIATEQARQEGIKGELKATLAEIAGRRSMLAGLVSSGEEYRDVECEDAFDHDAGRVTRSRKDTGEVIGERPMTSEERQRSFLGDL